MESETESKLPIDHYRIEILESGDRGREEIERFIHRCYEFACKFFGSHPINTRITIEND